MIETNPFDYLILLAGEVGPSNRFEDLCKVSLKVEVINSKMDYAILRSPVSRRYLEPYTPESWKSRESWRELQLSELRLCTFSLSTLKQLEEFDYSAALMSVRVSFLEIEFATLRTFMTAKHLSPQYSMSGRKAGHKTQTAAQ